MSGELALSEDQRDLAAMALAFADEHTDPAAVLAGADPLWTDKQLAAAGDLGLTGLLTEDGGGTHTDLAVVVEQLGRTGSALPIAPVALAWPGPRRSGLPDCACPLSPTPVRPRSWRNPPGTRCC